MTSLEVAQALAEWAEETVPGGLESSYPYSPAELGLTPLVVVEITGIRHEQRADDELPFQQIEQQTVRVYNADLVFAVDPTDPEQATETLYGYADALEAAVLDDPTLGGRVTDTGNEPNFELPPFHIEFDDGTEVRPMTAQIRVAVPRAS